MNYTRILRSTFLRSNQDTTDFINFIQLKDKGEKPNILYLIGHHKSFYKKKTKRGY